MTTTITTYSDQAQLALAAYAVNLTPAMDRDVYKTALMANNSMTAIQADRFIARYEIIDSQQNTVSGFAATLFRERVTPETLAAGTAGQYRLAVRGTEFDIDKVGDLLLADAGGILLNGVARAQVTDMYNSIIQAQAEAIATSQYPRAFQRCTLVKSASHRAA